LLHQDLAAWQHPGLSGKITGFHRFSVSACINVIKVKQSKGSYIPFTLN
jgi:hypothetical protein